MQGELVLGAVTVCARTLAGVKQKVAVIAAMQHLSAASRILLNINLADTARGAASELSTLFSFASVRKATCLEMPI
jgi:hypothetical protein